MASVQSAVTGLTNSIFAATAMGLYAAKQKSEKSEEAVKPVPQDVEDIKKNEQFARAQMQLEADKISKDQTLSYLSEIERRGVQDVELVQETDAAEH